MMAIKIGDFIRTKFGEIGVVTKKLKEKPFSNSDCGWYMVRFQGHERSRRIGIYENDKEIKHSKNIIDLIEVGDFVEMNAGTQFNSFYRIYSTEFLRDIRNYYNAGARIKTILTHEQYKQNCFRMEE